MDYVVTESGADPEDTLPVDYEPERIRAFYGRRPAAVATRVSQIAYQASGFGLSLVLDAIRGQLEDSSVTGAAAAPSRSLAARRPLSAHWETFDEIALFFGWLAFCVPSLRVLHYSPESVQITVFKISIEKFANVLLLF